MITIEASHKLLLERARCLSADAAKWQALADESGSNALPVHMRELLSKLAWMVEGQSDRCRHLAAAIMQHRNPELADDQITALATSAASECAEGQRQLLMAAGLPFGAGQEQGGNCK